MKASNTLIKTAEELLIAGKFIESEDLLLKALEKDPTNPEVYYLLGDVLCKLKRFEDAITMLQKADQLLPKHPRIYHLLGWAIFMNGDTPAGRTFMEIALKAEPENNQIYADLAVLEMKAHNFDKAREYIVQGRKIAPYDEILAEVGIVVDRMEQAFERAKNKKRSN